MSMLGPEAIAALAAGMRACGLASLELDLPGGETLRLTRPTVGGSSLLPAGANLATVTSPVTAPPLTSPGPGLFEAADLPRDRRVAVGAIVGFLRAGDLLRPITAPRSGLLGECLVTEGALLGFGSPVFAFDAE